MSPSIVGAWLPERDWLEVDGSGPGRSPCNHKFREHSDGRSDEEARIVAQVGDWIGRHVFGPLGAKLIAAHPAIVVVRMPDPDEGLAMLPLESARIGGKSLPMHGVTLVTVGAGEQGPRPRASGRPW